MSKLFDNFEKVSLQDWNEKIIKDLKGSNYRKKLVSFTEGIEINPVYSDENIEKIHPINFPSDWISFQEIDAIHAKTANQKALLALNNDVSGLSFINPNNLDLLLEGIAVNDIAIKFTNYHSDFINEWKYYCDINNITITAITDENIIIPETFDYAKLHSVSTEGKEKLSEIKPKTIGQASRISGVSPSDINVLLIYIGR